MVSDQEKVGIVGWGVAFPVEMLDTKFLARERKGDENFILNKLGLKKKSVAHPTEDSITLATEAADNAIRRAGINPRDIQTVLVGSESKPYAVGQTARHVASFLGVGNSVSTTDMEAACAPGMQAVYYISSQIKAKDIRYGLAIGSDVSQAPEGDALEYATGAGAGALVLGREDTVANITDIVPYSSLTLDFWRREGQSVPSHFGKTTVYAFLEHVFGALQGYFSKHSDKKLSDFTHIFTHQPSRYVPEKAIGLITGNYKGLKAEDFLDNTDFIDRMRLTPEEYKNKFLRWVDLSASNLGNTYAASTSMILGGVLDVAKPGEDILAISYGSGAYTQATAIHVEEGIEKKRRLAPSFQDYLNRRINLSIQDFLFRSQKKMLGLEFPRFVGVLESERESGELTESFCDECERIYYPQRKKCLDPNCKEPLILKDFPKVGRIETVRKLPLDKRPNVYKTLRSDEVALLSYKEGDLVSGMEVEANVRRVYSHSNKDIIIYAIIYGKKFRENFSNALVRELFK